MNKSVVGSAVVLALACAATMGIGGCTASYKQQETSGLQSASVQLDRARNIFIAVPADGQFGSRTYAGTGRGVAQKAAAAFSRYAQRVEVGGTPDWSRDQLLAAARKAGAGYLVIPSITHWEARATEWSGIPSRVSMSLTVIDTATGAEVRSALLESRSATMTFIRPNPDNLAQQMLDQQIGILYGVQPPTQ